MGAKAVPTKGPPPRASGRALQAAMGRAAIALNSTLELRAVLDVLMHEILVNTDAHRASVLLCRSGWLGLSEHATGPHAVPRWLEPAASLGREHDPVLWQAFRDTGPIELDADQRRAFARARAVALTDAAASELIPAGLAERFRLESVVLVPLFATGDPCGLLVVDYARRERFEDEEVRLLEVIAELAGVAVANARLHEQTRRRARLRDVLARAGAELARPRPEPEVVERLTAAVCELLDTEVAGAGRLDGDGWLRPLLITGGHPLPDACPLDEVPEHLVAHVTEEWARGVTRACELGADPWLLGLLPPSAREQVASFLLLPLLARGVPVGAVLAGLPDPGPLPREVVEAAETLAVIGGTAMERRLLLSRGEAQLARLAAMDRLIEAVPAPVDATSLRDAMNEVLAGHGVEAVSLGFADRRLRRWLHGSDPTEVDQRLWERAAADGPRLESPTAEVVDDGTLAVVLWDAERPVGAARVRPSGLDQEQAREVAAIAAMAGRLAVRSAEHGEAHRATVNRLLVDERDRVIGELQRGLGGLHRQLALQSTQLAAWLRPQQRGHRGPQRLARLVQCSAAELAQTIRGLEHEPTAAHGLADALGRLGDAVSRATHLDVEVVELRELPRLSLEAERALYRVGAEALTTIRRATSDRDEDARDEEAGDADASPVGGGADEGPSPVAVQVALDAGRRRATVTVSSSGRVAGGAASGGQHLERAISMGRWQRLHREMERLEGRLRLIRRKGDGLTADAWLPRDQGSRVAGGRRSASDCTPYGLTATEHQVLQLLAQDLTYREIAEATEVTTNTVKTHVSSVFAKLGVAGRRAAAHKAVTEALIDPPSRGRTRPPGRG